MVNPGQAGGHALCFLKIPSMAVVVFKKDFVNRVKPCGKPWARPMLLENSSMTVVVFQKFKDRVNVMMKLVW